VSIHTHLLRDEHLFSAAIMQSGTVTLCGIMEIDEYQVVYEKFLRELGISTSLSSDERLSQLLQVDAERLVIATAQVLQVPCQTWRLCDDSVLLPGRRFPRYHNYDQFHVPDWCREIMIGDCTHEAIIWADPYQNITAEQLLERMNSFFGSQKASLIADIYGISSDLPQQEAFHIFEKMTSDAMYIMLDYFAAIAQPRVYAYHFDVAQPWKGKKWSGIAHHSFDNVLVWGILKTTLPPAQQEISEKMSEAWLRFANGMSPWERFGDNQRWMVVEETGMTMKDRLEDERRGYSRFDRLHKEGLVGDLGNFSDNLCLVTSEVLSLNTA
jgi:carboxylesterase type B